MLHSTGSDELSSGFLAGLKELGLTVGDIDKPTAKSKQTQPKNDTSEPRRRSPTKRTAINIDALMDGIDAPVVEERRVPETPVRQYRPVISSDLDIERSISDYLGYSISLLRDEFVTEIGRLLHEFWNLEPRFAQFGDEIRQLVRDEINSIYRETDIQPITAPNCFDQLSPRFRSVFQEIEDQKRTFAPEIIRTLRDMTAEVASHSACLKSQFSPDFFSAELQDLRDSRTNARATKDLITRRTRRVYLQRLDLETEEIRQKIESDLIRSRTAKIDEGRRRLEEQEFGTVLTQADEMKLNMRDLILELESDLETNIRHGTLRKSFSALSRALGSLRSVRHEYGEQLGKFKDYVIVQKSPEKKDQRLRSPRVRNREKVKETRLATAVQRRLKMLQEKREIDLENTSRFLSSVRRKEMRRVRRQISSIIDPF
jgi:hypothetical protein